MAFSARGEEERGHQWLFMGRRGGRDRRGGGDRRGGESPAVMWKRWGWRLWEEDERGGGGCLGREKKGGDWRVGLFALEIKKGWVVICRGEEERRVCVLVIFGMKRNDI